MANKPYWLLEKGSIDENLFVDTFLDIHPMVWTAGRFITRDGRTEDDREVLKQIIDMMNPWVTSNLAQRGEALLRLLRIRQFRPVEQPQWDRIYLKNGTYYLDGEFLREKAMCPHRLEVCYNPEAPLPEKWLSFLLDMLEVEDVLTLQEYLGYCLTATTRAQKMLMIIGRGGEGKSHIGYVMQAIFGSAMYTSSIQKVENNRFARADLEGKLLMVDDDLDLNALKKTNYIKSIVTARGTMDVERKGQQSYQARLFVRFLCFGNEALSSLYDRSDGFFRRQIILTTRPIPPGRRNNAFLEEDLVKEKEGILLWMIQGLHRLISRNFQFTLSDQARENLTRQMRSGNNILDFMDSEGYFRFHPEGSATTTELYGAYRLWCGNNAELPLGMKTFSSFLSQHQENYGLRHVQHMKSRAGQDARGYVGIDLLY